MQINRSWNKRNATGQDNGIVGCSERSTHGGSMVAVLIFFVKYRGVNKNFVLVIDMHKLDDRMVICVLEYTIQIAAITITRRLFRERIVVICN